MVQYPHYRIEISMRISFRLGLWGGKKQTNWNNRIAFISKSHIKRFSHTGSGGVTLGCKKTEYHLPAIWDAKHTCHPLAPAASCAPDETATRLTRMDFFLPLFLACAVTFIWNSTSSSSASWSSSSSSVSSSCSSSSSCQNKLRSRACVCVCVFFTILFNAYQVVFTMFAFLFLT